jgi:hypothetical protein
MNFFSSLTSSWAPDAGECGVAALPGWEEVFGGPLVLHVVSAPTIEVNASYHLNHSWAVASSLKLAS